MVDESPEPNWTAALVIAELRRPKRRAVIRALPESDEALPRPDLVALAERVLGRQSPEYRALLILAKPGIPIREWCREIGHSRATLYRRAGRGAAAMAGRLNENGRPEATVTRDRGALPVEAYP
jgi:DNA-directed RNA polymerase specialized sigma24 family protein